MNEAETRAEHIDPALKAAGWGVVEGSRIHREYSITPGRVEGAGRRMTSMNTNQKGLRLVMLACGLWAGDTPSRQWEFTLCLPPGSEPGMSPESACTLK